MSETHDDRDRVYILGHSDRELARLNRQAALVDGITRKLFTDAGLVAGMRVLDLGCGTGSVSMLAAQAVGPRGHVTGFDLSPAAVQTASDRCKAAGLENVSFRLGDPAQMLTDERFDAVVGRYVLIFIPDPATTLRVLAAHLPPGGIVAFHEPSIERTAWSVNVPTYDACARWFSQTMAAQGADVMMGLRLHECFAAAGLPAPTLSLAAGIGAGDRARDWVTLLLELLQTVRYDAIRLGIATEGELDMERLQRRIDDELSREGSVIMGRSEVGAWSRLS